MLPSEQRSRCDVLLERIDSRPPGLTIAVRLCFTADKEWLTPMEIRDRLKTSGFNFEAYRANPLTSIHTTLKRTVPHEMECKVVGGQKLYRLKSAAEGSAALADVREWAEGAQICVGKPTWQKAAV